MPGVADNLGTLRDSLQELSRSVEASAEATALVGRRCKQSLEELSEELTRLESVFRDLREHAHAALTSFDAVLEEETRADSALQERAELMEKEASRYRSELREAAAQLAAIIGHGEAGAGALEMSDENGPAGEAEGLAQRIGHLRSQLEEVTSENASLRSSVASLQEEIAALKEQIRQAVSADVLESLKKELATERARVRILEEQLHAERARGTKAQLAQELAEALKEAEQARQELEALRLQMTTQGVASEPKAAPPTLEEPSLSETSLGRRSGKLAFGELLRQWGEVTEEQLEEALAEQRANPQRHLGAILVEKGYATEDAVARALAQQVGVPYVDLEKEAIDTQAVTLVTHRLAQQHQCLPLQSTATTIRVAMVNPMDLVAIEDIERWTGRKAEIVVARASAIAEAIEKYFWEPV